MTDEQSTVLLVEDEPLIRLFIAELLEESGFKVIEAAHATEALTILDAGRRVDVLLTDVDMSSGQTGYELARTVCKSWSHIEILIMSGRRWPDRSDLPPGAAFLAKPCPNETIVSHVRSAALRAKRPEERIVTAPEQGSAEILPFPKTA